MSQYSISLKSIIDISSFPDVIENMQERVKFGREFFFNFEYEASKEFKELFENKFILDYLREDICYDDIDYWQMTLENAVKSKIPTYSKMYDALKKIATDEIISDNVSTHTHIGESHNKANSESSGNSKSKGLGSSYPVDIAEADDFSDVKYMDNGNINEANSSGKNESVVDNDDKSTDKTVFNKNTLEKLNTLNKAQFDVIQGAVSSLSNLFMVLW